MGKMIRLLASIFLVLLMAFGALAEMSETEKQNFRELVDKIYKEEGGKRSKDVITKEIILESMFGASNKFALEKIKEGNYKSAKETIEIVFVAFDRLDSNFKKIVVPEMAISYHILGDIFFQKNETAEKAITAYEAALKINPKLATAHYNLGFLYSLKSSKTQKKIYLDKGKKHFETAFLLDPSLIELAEKQMEDIKK